MSDVASYRIDQISSENEAWDRLKAALETESAVRDQEILKFDNWPLIDVYLPETPVEASMSPTMMTAFIDLQTAIYRAHKFVENDTGDLRSLSKGEREDFEFRVKVKPGSSGYEVDLSSVLSRIGVEAISKMDPVQVVIVVLGIALIIGGVSSWKAWLHFKTTERQNELDNEEKIAFLEERKAISEEDTKRFELLLEAQQRQPLLADVEASVDSARLQIVKAVSDEKGGRVMGTAIDPEFGSEITATKRQQSEEVRLAGFYRVAKVDTTVSDGFRVTLEDIRGGSEVVASMQDAVLSGRHKQVIQNAEWSKTSVYIEMKAKRLRNRVVDAIVLAASETEPET